MESNFAELLVVLLTVVNLCVYLFIIGKLVKKWGFSKAHNRFIVLLFLVFFWITTRYLENVPELPHTFLTKIDFSLAALISGVYASFAIHFSGLWKKFSVRNEVALFIIPLILSVISFTNIIVRVTDFRTYEYHFVYFFYISALILFFIIIGIGSLLTRLRNSTGIQRQQLGYIAFGSITAISILIYDSINNAVGVPRPIIIDRLFFNASILFVALAAYAMAKHRFLDIRIVIKRSVVRVLSFLIVFGLYLLLILILKDNLVASTKEINPISIMILGLFIFVTVEPLRKYIYNFVDKRFELHDRQQERIQKQLQIVLKSQRSLSDLEQAIRKAFQETASVDNVDYIDADDQKLIGKPALRAFLQSTGKIVICEELPYRLDEDPRFKQVNDEVKGGTVTAYVPVGQNEIFVGCFVLGQRKGKVAYSAQEVSAMKLLQSQATDAFLNARLYKQAVERIKV